jgi:two-component system sensor histidine kinase BaeS
MKITTKLFLAIFGLTSIVLIATLSLARWSFQQGFLDYINALEQQRLESIAISLANRYQQNPTALLQIKPAEFRQILYVFTPKFGSGMPPPREHPPEFDGQPLAREPHGLRRPNFARPDQPAPLPKTTLTDMQGHYIAGDKAVLSAEEVIQYPVIINEREIALLWSEPKRQFDSIQATEFANQQQQTSIVLAIIFLLLAGFVALLLAKRLLNPIKQAILVVKQLAKGEYQITPLPKQQDELGELMRDIERLAHTLSQTQQAKNRWLANISHELRTPLTILMGELEMISAGIRSFDEKQQQSFSQEVHRLMHLVDDLYQLSLADIGGLRYQFSTVVVADCIEQAIAATQSKQESHQLAITTHLLPHITITADHDRLVQLFINLIVNSCYYTDAPGQLVISMNQDKGKLIIEFADSAPGVDDQALEQLFDSLYREDEARTRVNAGAGLGLTICKTIVQAHQANITAQHADLGGVAIVITFELEQ